MKLKLENGDEIDVKFWSFFKAFFLSSIVLNLMFFGVLFLIGAFEVILLGY